MGAATEHGSIDHRFTRALGALLLGLVTISCRPAPNADLSGEVETFYDPTNSLTFDQVRTRLSEFEAAPPTDPNRIVSLSWRPGTYWLHLELDRGRLSSRALIEAPVAVADVTMYREGHPTQRAGQRVGMAERSLEHRSNVFLVDFGEDERSTDLFFRFVPGRRISFPVAGWSQLRFTEAVQPEYLGIGLYIGALAIMIAHSLVLAILLRMRIFALYALATLILGAAVTYDDRILQQFLFPGGYGDHHLAVLTAISPAAGLLFLRDFFDVKRLASWLDRVMIALVLLSLTCCFHGFIPSGPLRAWHTSVIYIGAAGSYVVANVLALRAGQRAARYAPPAFALTAIVVVLTALMVNGVIPEFSARMPLYRLALVMQQAILSFALYDFYRRLQEQRLAERRTHLGRQEQLRQLVSAKSEFLAAASHDLRQPLHAQALFISALEPHAIAPEAAHILSRIGDTGRVMQELLDGLLDLSKLEAGVIVPVAAPFAVQRLLDSIEHEFAAIAADKGLQLRVMPCSAVAHGDLGIYTRIARNLISNAIRYTERGRVVVGVRRGNPLRLCVLDTGVGIARTEQRTIFDEYVQVPRHEGKGERHRGVGLGLSIVRKLCGLIGAEISVRSVPGRGSAFFATVEPTAEIGALVVSPDAPTAAQGVLRGRSVLVIDDERFVLEAVRSYLESIGCVVHAAQSLDDALAIARSQVVVDAMLVDHHLGGDTTGMVVIERVHGALGAVVPTLIVTGDTSPERIRAASRSGVPLLHKPIATAVLVEALATSMKTVDSRSK